MRTFLIGLVCFAAGFLGGLLVDVIFGTPRAQLRRENASLEDRLKMSEADLAEARATWAVEAKERYDAQQKAKAAEKVQKAAEQLAVGHLEDRFKLNALVCMMRDNQAIVDLVRTPRFVGNFKGPWYCPDEAYKLTGGRWFFEESAKCGALEPGVIEKAREIWADQDAAKP